MMGRLALTDHTAANDRFESFLELLPPLAKDPALSLVFRRIFIQIAMRNPGLYEIALQQANLLHTIDSGTARENASSIIGQLEDPAVRELVYSRNH